MLGPHHQHHGVVDAQPLVGGDARVRMSAAMLSSTPSGVRLERSRAELIVITECTVTTLVPAATPRSTLMGTHGLAPSSSSPKQNE